jgi:uncharacterized protein (TIGR02147 family)
MPTIFDYTDYRKFLADYYEEKKKTSASFSFQNFSRMAGFTSKSFVFNVIHGRKNLSRSSSLSMAEAMCLKKNETAYFEALVSFNQAASFKERDFSFEKLNSIRPSAMQDSVGRRLRREQYEYFSKWYHAAIRALIDIVQVKNDYALVGRMLYPPVPGKQVKESVRLLERLGLIARKRGGAWKICDKIVSTGPEVQSHAAHRFHLATMELAAKALRELPRNDRNISGLTLGISKEAYEKTREALYECQDKILAIAKEDKNPDGVYQVNFHLFPLSKGMK